MNAARLLREARLRAGLSQEQLALRTGTRQSAIARWESGAISPRSDTLVRLLRGCGFEPQVTLVPSVDDEADQIRERLAWTPKQRLDYLVDMIAFEERARRAQRLPHRPAPALR